MGDCAFVDEVSQGDAHLFYVRINKYLTVDERKALVLKSRRARKRLCQNALA